ncbi:iron-siderophore ABC transporter substrate-binding protein [Streptosporangium oxazolinicum]|uniref:Iron-siderophore ABC transporter substrate-binding protein n=1 Tax=Streptosporangium oxazolinicum TaxID=909287 RepID=A0ABP8AJR9_9ACTN
MARVLPLRLAGALASIALLISAAGCGSGSSTTSAEPAGTGQATGQSTQGAASAFPVTIAHKYASTTIKAAPKRIVTVGLTDQDALLALGVVPVATTEWFGGYPGAVGPWAKEELGSAAVPEVLKDTGGGPQFEKIAALRPDLILGLYSGLTQEQYDTLSKIAPTVAQPKEYSDFGIPWQELTRKAGQAVGKAEEADRLVAELDARIAADVAAHPEFKGASGLMATPYEGYFVFGSEDPRSRLLTSLGFALPADLDNVIGDKFGASISRERLDLLDTDVIVWSVANAETERAKLHADKVYADLGVVKEGREVIIAEGTAYGNAVSFVSVLSLPYLLDRLVPQLADAVDGDPATEVKPAQ